MYAELKAEIGRAYHEWRAERGLDKLMISGREFTVEKIAEIQRGVVGHMQAAKSEVTRHDEQLVKEAGIIANKSSALKRLAGVRAQPVLYGTNEMAGRCQKEIRAQFVAGGVGIVDPLRLILEEPYETTIRNAFDKPVYTPQVYMPSAPG